MTVAPKEPFVTTGMHLEDLVSTLLSRGKEYC